MIRQPRSWLIAVVILGVLGFALLAWWQFQMVELFLLARLS